MTQISWNEVSDRATEFSSKWKGETYEKGESQSFWSDFLAIFGVDRRRHGAFFEYAVKKGNGKQGFIDLFYPSKLLAEQKSGGKDLNAANIQAFEYLANIPDHDLPEAIVVSDFSSFEFINLATREKTTFSLEELNKHVRLFGFLLGQTSKNIAEQDPVNRNAAEAMARLHNQLKDDNYTGHNLEVLLVRLVFIMFADDSGIFDRAVLLEYLQNRTSPDGSDLGSRLSQIFQILNTPNELRQTSLDEDIASLPYVNGGLFEEQISVPNFTGKMRSDLISAMELDWSKVSPAIFGSMFQGVMDEKERRNLGAHYTSEENILKVIKPLFLDELYDEFRLAKLAGPRKKITELKILQLKLSNLKFLDPACGCGNFLVITYRELRKLEHKIVSALKESSDQAEMFVGAKNASPLKVNVDQMYGIEIEEFPSLIAQTALWLTDHQMNVEFSMSSEFVIKRIPLRTSPTIVNKDALSVEWNEVVEPGSLDYILGNPPFIGSKMMTPEKRDALLREFKNVKGAGVLDFVSAWYAKSAKLMSLNKDIKTALVSTNSIVQGEQALILWKYLFELGININFAHQTFKWVNEAKGKAAVYCVIIGFSFRSITPRLLYKYADITKEPAEFKPFNINGYLIDAPSIFIERRGKPISDIPPMSFGNMPLDGGNLILSNEEKIDLILNEPESAKYIKRLIGARELLHGGFRWCLWLVDVEPGVLRQMPEVLKRIEATRNFRLGRDTKSTRDHAVRPAEFRDTSNPESYIVVPRVTSEKREYIPMGFFGSNDIPGDTCQVVPNATTYEFGILTSRLHMAWMRTVAGRLENRYRYSKDIVYNNFVWIKPSKEQRSEIMELAQEILDKRNEYPNDTLADLYHTSTMPLKLLKAHQNLDRAVDKLYGLNPSSIDSERVSHLFELYQQATKPAI
jgi:hypothetical protein